MSGWWYGEYKPAAPLQVQGGIKASGKGGFAKKWWGKRWLEVLESFHIGTRLARGRGYAKKGQVANLSIETGRIKASVQGTRARPYTITVELAPYSETEWEGVLEEIRENPLVAARLLAGDMPEELEELCARKKLPLFPKKRGDMTTNCSCPDRSNPCKHIAAVFYVMAEAFDGDPFLLLRLRGLDREAFLARLGPVSPEDIEESEEISSPCPLPAEPAIFWDTAGDTPDIAPLSAPGKTHAALLRRLGTPPFWRGSEGFAEAMTAIYETAACGTEALHREIEENGGKR